MTHRAGLARQAAANDLADDVILSIAAGCDQWLAEDHAEHRACKIRALFLAVDVDAPGARLQPHAGDRVLALAGGVDTALPVDLWAAIRWAGTGLGLLGFDQR